MCISFVCLENFSEIRRKEGELKNFIHYVNHKALLISRSLDLFAVSHRSNRKDSTYNLTNKENLFKPMIVSLK